MTRNLSAGAWTLISLVGSIPIAAVFLWLGEKTKELSFAVSPTRPEIVRAGIASSVTAFHNDMLITGNLSAIQFAVWNQGRDPIRQPEDILRTVTVKPAAGMKILDAKVVNATRDEIEFSIAPPAANGDIVLKWRILENGDGALVQLLVVDAPDEPITVSGTIVGQGSLGPNSVRNTVRTSTPYAAPPMDAAGGKTGTSGRRIFLYLFIVVTSLLALGFGIWVYRRKTSYDPNLKKSAAVELVLLVCVTVAFILYMLRLDGFISPFGF